MFRNSIIFICILASHSAFASEAKELFRKFLAKKDKIDATITQKMADLDLKPNPDLQEKIFDDLGIDEKTSKELRNQLLVFSPPRYGFRAPSEKFMRNALTEITKDSWDTLIALEKLPKDSETDSIIAEIKSINKDVRNRSYFVGTNMHVPKFKDHLVRCLTTPSYAVLEAAGIAKDFRSKYYPDDEQFMKRNAPEHKGFKTAQVATMTIFGSLYTALLPACIKFSTWFINEKNKSEAFDGTSNTAEVITFDDIPYGLGASQPTFKEVQKSGAQ